MGTYKTNAAGYQGQAGISQGTADVQRQMKDSISGLSKSSDEVISSANSGGQYVADTYKKMGDFRVAR